jgi:phage terminase Nu1 subunit (DNA packaging protein)
MRFLERAALNRQSEGSISLTVMQTEGVSAEVLGRWLGASQQTVTQFARRGIMVRAGRGKFDLEASVRGYATHLREAVSAQGRPPTQSGTGRERARLAAAMA